MISWFWIPVAILVGMILGLLIVMLYESDHE